MLSLHRVYNVYSHEGEMVIPQYLYAMLFPDVEAFAFASIFSICCRCCIFIIIIIFISVSLPSFFIHTIFFCMTSYLQKANIIIIIIII